MWIVVFYGIKEEWTIWSIPTWFFGIILLLVPIILSWVCLKLTLSFGRDVCENCTDLENVNSSFLPSYLAYVFIGLSVVNLQHLIFVYLIILVFTQVSRTHYFNPIFLLFGYSFYNVKTLKGTNIQVIAKEEIRNALNVRFNNLRRINDSTFIAWKNTNDED
jgi:hypothetical protein